MQGWTWGYQALIFDLVHYIPESVNLPADPEELRLLAVNSLTPYDQMVPHALAALDEAILIAQQNPTVVNYPADPSRWFASPTAISNAKFIQMANTLAARIMVLNARCPVRRAGCTYS